MKLFYVCGIKPNYILVGRGSAGPVLSLRIFDRYRPAQNMANELNALVKPHGKAKHAAVLKNAARYQWLRDHELSPWGRRACKRS